MGRYVEYENFIGIIEGLKAVERETWGEKFDKFTFYYEHRELILMVRKEDSDNLFTEIKNEIYHQK